MSENDIARGADVTAFTSSSPLLPDGFVVDVVVVVGGLRTVGRGVEVTGCGYSADVSNTPLSCEGSEAPWDSGCRTPLARRALVARLLEVQEIEIEIDRDR